MKENIALIGNRAFFLEKGEKIYNGTERMLEVLINVLKDDYNVFLMCHNVNDHLIDMYKKEYNGLISDAHILKDNDDTADYLFKNKISKILVSGWISDELVNLINGLLRNIKLHTAIMVHGTNCSGEASDFVPSLTYNSKIKLITMTDHEEKLYIDNGFPKDRIIRVNNPVDLGSVIPYYLDSNPPEIIDDSIVVARMQVEKGIPNSAKICKAMGTRLAVRGKKYRGHVVRELARDYPDNHYLVDPMPRDDLLQFEKKFRFFILLNNIPEGQNLSVLEANALGVPVICWKDIGYAYYKFLDHEFNIFLDKKDGFEEQFMKEFYPNLDFYLNRENRKELSRRTCDKFGFDRYKDNILSIINNL